jgi:hypothetical protein
MKTVGVAFTWYDSATFMSLSTSPTDIPASMHFWNAAAFSPLLLRANSPSSFFAFSVVMAA